MFLFAKANRPNNSLGTLIFIRRTVEWCRSSHGRPETWWSKPNRSVPEWSTQSHVYNVKALPISCQLLGTVPYSPCWRLVGNEKWNDFKKNHPAGGFLSGMDQSLGSFHVSFPAYRTGKKNNAFIHWMVAKSASRTT